MRPAAPGPLRSVTRAPDKPAWPVPPSIYGPSAEIAARGRGLGAAVPEEDRTYIASLVAERAGISQAEAEERVDAFVEEARTEAAEAKAAAEEAAETARQIGILLAFTGAATLLVSAAAAWWGARRGGRHRDEGTVVGFLVPGRMR